MTSCGVLVSLLVCVALICGQAPSPRIDFVIQVQGRANQQAVEATSHFNVDLMLAQMNSNDDNYINGSEISSYIATMDDNRNGNIESCEFVNHYTHTLNVSSMVASFLYNVLNSPTNDHFNGSTVFAYDEISGQGSLSEIRLEILQGVYNAGLLAFGHRDVILAVDNNVLPPSPEVLVNNTDSDRDGVVSVSELNAVFSYLDTDGNDEVSRCEMHASDEARGFDSTATGLVYDVIDNDNDDVISRDEFIADLLAADTIVPDKRVTREEYTRHLARRNWVTRQRAGLPLAPPHYRCHWMDKPHPIPHPSFDVRLWVADADSDFDGAITQKEYYDLVDTYFERNDNGKLSRCEFQTRATSRYNVTRRQANAIYDAFDSNRDDEVSPDEVDVMVADYNADGLTTTCELYLFMTHLASKAEGLATRRAEELARKREDLYRQALWRQQGGQPDMANSDSALNAYLRGDNPSGKRRGEFMQAWLFALFKKWMAYGQKRFNF